MAREGANADPLNRLRNELLGYSGLLVAFSAGVDSGLLLAAATRFLGTDKVLAVTAVSPSLPVAEREYAKDFARVIGVRHLEATTQEMLRPGYRENTTSRCYFCKAELLDVIGHYLSELPPHARVATGTNADDLVAGFRPGIRAAAQRGAVTPLADAGMSKQMIRDAARQWGLPVWDKPQAACLSSRIAYGIQISPRRLARVEAAEMAVRRSLTDSGVASVNVRVRDLGEQARIEVDAELAGTQGAWHNAAVSAVLDAGFRAAWIDPQGFRSGSMNEAMSTTT
jgi:uncharacterized protein